MTDDLLPTRSALAYLGSTKTTLLKYAKLGEVQCIDLGGVKHYPKQDLDKLLVKLRSPKNGRPGGTSKTTRRPEEFKAAVNKLSGIIDPGDDDADDDVENPLLPAAAVPTLESLGLQESSTPKEIVTALQRRIASLVVQHRVLETLVADLNDPDWKARQGAGDSSVAFG